MKPTPPTTGEFASRRPRVLLVDDDAAVAATTAALLEDDFDVTTASDGRAALVLLAHHCFEVVCSDYAMPSMTGIELLERVGSLPGFVSRVLVTGAREERERWEPRRDQDLYYVLLKPYEPTQLLDLVTRAAAQTALRRRIADAGREARRSAERAMNRPVTRESGTRPIATPAAQPAERAVAAGEVPARRR